MSTTDTLIDTLFDGRYHIRRRVGVGGMASVYLADDETLGRPVAIKILDQRHSADAAFVERFLREASAAARLSHANIVQVYDRGEAAGTYYIAMEFVDGLTLKDLIRRRGPLTEAEVLAYGKQAANALKFAHRNGVVHRDIKPHNMMIDGEGRLKIADFGIARAGADSGLTEDGSIVGTAQYLSPEQAQGHAVAATSDLYSLGVVLFEMATGRVPFPGDSPVNVALRHVSEEPPRPSSINPQVTPAVEAIIMRALRKEPALRYQTADEMLGDLDSARMGTVASETAALTRVVPVGAGGGALSAVQPIATSPLDAESAYHDSMAGDDEEQASGGGWKTPALIGLAIALIVVLAAGLLWSMRTQTAEQVSVKNVIGQTRAEAVATLNDQGLEPNVLAEQEFSEEPAGTVIDQDPTGGTKVDAGAAVDLTISKGPKPATMPDVMGTTRQEARSRLSAAGIDAGRVTFEEEYSDRRQGTVIAQDPPANADVSPDATITITLSKGTETTTVPDVTSLDLASARSKLEQSGFIVSIARQDSPESRDTILSQNPAAGRDADNGTTVTLTVASGYNAVPNVVGKTAVDAKAAIEDAGFAYAVTSTQVDPTMNPGDPDVVLTQSISGQHKLLGAQVGVVIAKAPAGP